jgi:hypothetical protein
MGWTRNLLLVVVVGVSGVLINSVLDRAWPDYCTKQWLILIGGYVVMAVVLIVIDSLRGMRRRTP